MSVTLSSLPETWTRAGRDAARAVVRAALGYDAWLARNPDVNRNAITKPEIIQAAEDLGLVDKVAAAVLAEMIASGHVVDEVEVDGRMVERKGPDMETADIATLGNAGVDEAAVEAALAGVLNPVRQYLAPGLVDGIAKSIRPYVVDALKPATVIEKIVTIPAVAVAPAGVAPYARMIGNSTMGKIFSLRGEQAKIPVTLWDANQLIPDPTYQVDVSIMAQAATAMEHGEVVLLAGPSGSGKGSLAREFAARTGRPFVRIGFDGSTEVVDLRGQPEPVPGETHGARMEWIDKVFVSSIRRPGTVILLDELSTAPRTAAFFQTVLDDKQVTLPTGEIVNFALGVVVVIADNTAGYGDPTGAYVGTQPMNAALIDRCGRVVAVDYLPVKQETLALQKKTNLPHAACERLALFAKHVRSEAAKAGGEARPFTFRRLVAFVLATYRDRLTVNEAWDIACLTRLPEADRETFRQLVKTQFKADDYVREMNGETIEAEPSAPLSQAPEQTNARDIFARS